MASQAASGEARKTTRRKTRRLPVWLKNSVAYLSHAEEAFEEEEREQNEEEEHAYAAEDEQAQAIDQVWLCHNIDEAMEFLHGYISTQSTQQFQAYTCKDEYDWILDGHVSWTAEQERSLQLLEELRGADLDDMFTEAGEKQKTKGEKEEEEEEEFGDFQTAGEGEPRVDEATENSQVQPQQATIENSHVVDVDATESSHGDTQEEFHSPLHVERALQYHDKKNGCLVYASLDFAQDVSSPEGRFARRHHLDAEEEREESDLELDEYYFSDPASDSTLRVLREMPWNHVPILHSNVDTDPTVVEQHLCHQLSQLDASHSKVNHHLLNKISKRTHQLNKGNNFIHEMDHNLRMAEMYVQRSRDSVKHARGDQDDFSGIAGATALLHDFDKRDDLHKLQYLLDKVARLLEKEQEVNNCIRAFGTDASLDHGLILELARLLYKEATQDFELSRLGCLNELRKRSSVVVGAFRHEIECTLCSYVVRLVHCWSSCSGAEYERLFRAILDVQHCQRETSESKEYNGEPDISQSWTKCIVDTLCYQADKCFARALLDPTDSTDSEHDRELIQLGFELRQDTRDAAKLISLTHNLVTIRFDFEANQNYLPMVYHRLVALLTDLLHAHYLLIKIHNSFSSDGAINSECRDVTMQALVSAKVDIWRRCEQVLVKCLDQYHHFAAKRKLFIRDKDDGGLAWMEDVEGLHDVLRLTQQFLSLGHEFLDADQYKSAQVTDLTSGDSALGEGLCQVFRKHLRAVHVEAMTSTGASLFKESWRLMALNVSEGVVKTNDREQSVKGVLLGAIQACKHSYAEGKQRYWQNEFTERTNHDSSSFESIPTNGNPFLSMSREPRVERVYMWNPCILRQPVESQNLQQHPTNREDSDLASEEQDHCLFSTICALLDNEDHALPTIATDSASNELIKWTARLLSVIEKLPLIADDVTKIFRDLYDLYFITAFRLCAGNTKSEKIILGIDPATPLFSHESDHEIKSPRSILNKKEPPSRFMGFGRRPSQPPVRNRRDIGTPAVSRNAEADICAPLPSEARKVALLRDFIISGQDNLGTCVKLDRMDHQLKDPIPPPTIDAEFTLKVVDILKKRQCAAWSCLFVAALLDVACTSAEKSLKASFLNQITGVDESRPTPEETPEDGEARTSLDSLATYSKTVSLVAPFLVNLSSRIACVRAILGGKMVKEVSTHGMIVHKLHRLDSITL